MISLKELQSTFIEAMFKGPNSAAVTELGQLLCDHRQLTAEQQITIYRNSIIGCMINALRQTYPVCDQLVGDQFFDAMATQFIYQQPSQSPDLGDYGAPFADFISAFKPTAELPYLADIARLEWAWKQAFSAVDHRGLDLQAVAQLLAQLDEQQQQILRFQLPPGSSLIESAYPIAKIWQMNQDDDDSDGAIDLSAGGDKLLVWRQDFDMRIDRLNSAQWRFLSAIQQDRPFIDICDSFADDPLVAIETLMPACVQQGWIADIRLPH